MSEPSARVLVVGPGAVGTSLAACLARAGVPVVGLYGRDAARTEAAARLAGAPAFSGPLSAEALASADVVIVAVRDPEVGQAAAALVDSGVLRRDVVFLHCGGARASAVAFGDVRARALAVGTFHPLRSFVAGRVLASLAGTAFGLEGDPAAVRIGRQLAEKLGGRPLELPADAMALYHAGAVLASNDVVALFDAAVRTFGTVGIPAGVAAEALAPLLRSTLDNLEIVGLPGALTGPVARGDADTVRTHIAALRSAAPEVAPLYHAAARYAVRVAAAKGAARTEDLHAIERLLAEEDRGW